MGNVTCAVCGAPKAAHYGNKEVAENCYREGARIRKTGSGT